jgi:hypothetical protein
MWNRANKAEHMAAPHQICDVKIFLANSEPSTHGPSRLFLGPEHYVSDEGSVRKAGKRVRINAQLIDAATRAHLWADRFDGAQEDIFDLQDNITEHVIGIIEPQIRKAMGHERTIALFSSSTQPRCPLAAARYQYVVSQPS